jgi:malic enzyme
VRATTLIGLSGAPHIFSQEVVQQLVKNTERPTIFALSNPTEMAEILPEQAYKWSKGRAIYASGSPFPPVTYGDKVYHISEANNMYIYPGLGFGSYLCGARKITTKMFTEAAKVLSRQVKKSELEEGRLYPPVENMRDVSAVIASAVIERAIKEANVIDADHLDPLQVKARMYKGLYKTLLDEVVTQKDVDDLMRETDPAALLSTPEVVAGTKSSTEFM